MKKFTKFDPTKATPVQPRPWPEHTLVPTLNDYEALMWACRLVNDFDVASPQVAELPAADCILVWALAAHFDARAIHNNPEYIAFCKRHYKRIASPAFPALRERAVAIFAPVKAVRDLLEAKRKAKEKEEAHARRSAAVGAFSEAMQALLKEVSIDEASFMFKHEVLHHRQRYGI